jgi:hypothetical protein
MSVLVLWMVGVDVDVCAAASSVHFNLRTDGLDDVGDNEDVCTGTVDGRGGRGRVRVRVRGGEGGSAVGAAVAAVPAPPLEDEDGDNGRATVSAVDKI